MFTSVNQSYSKKQEEEAVVVQTETVAHTSFYLSTSRWHDSENRILGLWFIIYLKHLKWKL